MSYIKKRKYDYDNDEKQFDKINDIMSETKITKNEIDGNDIIEDEYLKNEFFCVISEVEDKLDEYLDYDEILKEFIYSIIDYPQELKSENKKIKINDEDDYNNQQYNKIYNFMCENKITKKKSGDLIEKQYIKNELFCVISELEEKLKNKINYGEILKVFIKSVIHNNQGMKNRCTECNVDMGICNPRQLCGKTYCMSSFD